MDEDVIIEMWTRMKPFIIPREMMGAADAFVGVLDDNGLLDVMENEAQIVPDTHLRAALISYFGIDDGEDDEDSEWD